MCVLKGFFRPMVACMLLVGCSAQAMAADPRAKAGSESKAVDCDRKYVDKMLCPPKTLPPERKCEVLAQDIAGLAGRTGYSFEQQKTDMRRTYELQCRGAAGSEFECEHLGRDLSGSIGTKGYTAEVRKGDLRWIYDRRCAGGVTRSTVQPAIVVRE